MIRQRSGVPTLGSTDDLPNGGDEGTAGPGICIVGADEYMPIGSTYSARARGQRYYMYMYSRQRPIRVTRALHPQRRINRNVGSKDANLLIDRCFYKLSNHIVLTP